MWTKIYQEGHGPSVPKDKIFFSDAIKYVVLNFDDYAFRQAWQMRKVALRNDISAASQPNPKPSETISKLGIFDDPRPIETIENEDQLIERDDVAWHVEDAAYDIGMAAFDGSLIKTFYRAKVGGGMTEMPSAFWGTENDVFWERAHQCAFNPDDPYNPAADPTHWIYLERTSFFRFCDIHREYWSLPPAHRLRYKTDELAESGSDVQTSAETSKRPSTAKRGRKAKPEWVYVATALAEWIHARDDLASDIASTGPDVMLNEVLDLAALRCPSQLSRSTYQPAFQAVVERFAEIAKGQ